MLIKQEEEANKGVFYIEESGKLLAEMTYTMTGTNLLVIQHTEVSDELRGKNIGYQLVKTAVEFARDNNIKILPLCPFARSVFDKKKAEFGDVLRTN